MIRRDVGELKLDKNGISAHLFGQVDAVCNLEFEMSVAVEAPGTELAVKSCRFAVCGASIEL